VAAIRSAARREAAPRPPKTGIGMLLREADAAFNRYLRSRLAVHGVTFGQFQHLRNLWVEDGLTQAELSRRIGIEMASSTAILDSLEAQRLVTRVRNTADRRKINVFLTPSGTALEAPLMACAAEANRRASKGLSKAEVAQLFALAGRIIENFKTPPTGAFSAKVATGFPQKMRPAKEAKSPGGKVRRNLPRAAE
jgi:MarR family transcriptional regulator, organic hydroperoxide resistance regulator